MRADRAQIYTIPAGVPFLETLARAMLSGDLPTPGGSRPTPVTLAQATLMLPSCRTLRAVQDAFLRAADGAALLLPRIEAIGDGSEDGTSLAAAAGLLPETGDAPPAIGEMARRLTLTTLVDAWSSRMREAREPLAAVASAGAATPAQAVRLAGELARLMDLAETEGVDLARLTSLVPEDFSEHWGRTLAFLTILLDAWPAVLAAGGHLSAAARRNLMLRARAAQLAAHPPAGPIIVAGVTGTIPAQADVIRAVASWPNCAIVLPGLDLTADAATAAAIRTNPDHPQAALFHLLDGLGVDRSEVHVLGDDALTNAQAARAHLMREAFRPAATTDRWHDIVTATDVVAARAGLHGLSVIDTPTASDEAEVVALILREVLETPGRTGALVTPNRLLARRVVSRLAAWGITVDDSAGRPFAKTAPGAFLDLLLDMLASEFSPIPTIALLKHPLTRLGWSAAEARRAARRLELAVFRAPYLGRGLDGLDAALERAAREAVGDADLPSHRPRAVRRLSEADWAAARDLIARLRTAVQPWTELDGTRVPLQTLARVHAEVAQAIAHRDTTDGQPEPRSALFDDEAGEAAHALFIALVDPDLQAPSLEPRHYPDTWRALVADEVVHPRQPVHPRVSIWGPFEARLRQPDVIILGSMNEGTWPAAADPGPWLNRPMRAALGLSPPEAAIGRAAHDVATLLCGPRVYVTRASKSDGNPTVPSRWLMRVRALLGGLGLTDALQPDKPWLGWARARFDVAPLPPRPAPAPRPAVARRPRRLSVTEIERWMANPYAIYGRHILKLDPLPPLGVAPGAALKGAILHDALGRFARRNPTVLPDDARAQLIADIERVLAEYAAHPRVAAFWRPRLVRFADWFVATEAARRKEVTAIAAEVVGKHVFQAPAGPFTLTARADRIDRRAAGLTIIDYKTGTPPNAKAVASGRSPQLPLEALIAASGGFTDVAAAEATALAYIRATGGEPPGADIALHLDDLPAVIARAYDGLDTLIARFDDPATPYEALRRAAFEGAYAFDPYAHLARVSDWSETE